MGMKSGLVWIGVGRMDDGSVKPWGESVVTGGASAGGWVGAGAGVCAWAVDPSTVRLRARQATPLDQRGGTPAKMATLRKTAEELSVARRGDDNAPVVRLSKQHRRRPLAGAARLA